MQDEKKRRIYFMAVAAIIAVMTCVNVVLVKKIYDRVNELQNCIYVDNVKYCVA